MSDLNNKLILVTGSSKGIGKAIAIRFSDEGAKVVVNDVEPAYAESIAEKLKQLGREALAFRADVCDWNEVKLMFEQAVEGFGQVDILVNNAGIRKDVIFPEMSEEEWTSVIAVQLNGSFNCAKAAQRYMARQGYGNRR